MSVAFLFLSAGMYPQIHYARLVSHVRVGAQGVALIGLRLAPIVATDITLDDCLDARPYCREWKRISRRIIHNLPIGEDWVDLDQGVEGGEEFGGERIRLFRMGRQFGTN